MMRSYINTRQKCVEIWLTHGEAAPGQAVLQAFRQKQPGYRVVIFRSGTKDLVSATIPLLEQNLRA